MLDYETHVLMQDLYNYGKAGQIAFNPHPQMGRCALNNMLTVAFGFRTDTIEHPIVARALYLSREFM